MSQEQDSFKKYKDFLTSTAGIWLLIGISLGMIISNPSLLVYISAMFLVPILIISGIGALVWFFYKQKKGEKKDG